MSEKIAVIVTSIAGPNKVMQGLAKGCKERGYRFIVIGDQASPADFRLDGCDFYSLDRQVETGFKFAQLCPVRHYARKNIGYLIAIADGASVIIETDDDNIPYDDFWQLKSAGHSVNVVERAGWVNVYRYFTDANIWPRGMALEHINDEVPAFESLRSRDVFCPIQQGLADDNPDVDAIYRLTGPLPQKFRKDRRVALMDGSWCPFNSQNTTWWAEAFGLLYLPSFCSFRMTDIWRSFIAQRIAWVNGWGVLFGEPTMRQERNEHDLMRDFADEVPGYLNNSRLCEAIEPLSLSAGVEVISDNLRLCYEKLVEMALVGSKELDLVEAWNEDLSKIRDSILKGEI
ncbi:MAG: STELLO glycosyltransferase family protein [Planctomycetota bacterium]